MATESSKKVKMTKYVTCNNLIGQNLYSLQGTVLIVYLIITIQLL